MHIQLNGNTKVEVNNLSDLPKLKLLMDSLNLKINKSQLARELNVDRRTIDKYLNGYTPSKKRNRKSKIDDYYHVIKLLLLSEESSHKFYYKKALWQYLKDNHGLKCATSSFRAYISRKPEFQQYFDSNNSKVSSSGSHREIL